METRDDDESVVLDCDGLESAREEIEDAGEADETPVVSEAEELRDKYLRILAEFDNFRKRTSKEKAGMYDDGIVMAVTKLLPTLDNLQRALGAAVSQEDPLYKGVEMTLGQLLKTLEEIGVQSVEADAGHPFDPQRHFAVAHIQDEGMMENVIAEELQKGYMYKDRVLRHSMVRVAN